MDINNSLLSDNNPRRHDKEERETDNTTTSVIGT